MFVFQAINLHAVCVCVVPSKFMQGHTMKCTFNLAGLCRCAEVLRVLNVLCRLASPLPFGGCCWSAVLLQTLPASPCGLAQQLAEQRALTGGANSSSCPTSSSAAKCCRWQQQQQQVPLEQAARFAALESQLQ